LEESVTVYQTNAQFDSIALEFPRGATDLTNHYDAVVDVN